MFSDQLATSNAFKSLIFKILINRLKFIILNVSFIIILYLVISGSLFKTFYPSISDVWQIKENNKCWLFFRPPYADFNWI